MKRFEIKSRNDLANGAALLIRFPENDFDIKAYYTLERSWPDFLIPFHCQIVDGQVECVYQLGSNVKLEYYFGTRGTGEYIELWHQVLQPLLDCDDWFMKPFSFVLDTEYIYLDKKQKNALYIYIPSKEDCGDSESLKAMATKIAEKNSTADANLDNRILRALINSFYPREFLDMLKEYKSPSAPEPQNHPRIEEKEPPHAPKNDVKPPEKKQPGGSQLGQPNGDDPIGKIKAGIDSNGPGKKGGHKGGDEKKEKDEKSGKRKNWPFGSHKKSQDTSPAKSPEGKGENGNGKNYDQNPPKQSGPPASGVGVVKPLHEDDGVITEILYEPNKPYLRLLSSKPYPGVIEVGIDPGRSFTIGRFDVSVGHRQSNFEFEAKFTAVSRRHAVILRDGDSYSIDDLSSKFGTFVNGVRVSPNMPVILECGSTVSFGPDGADYIWEC